MATKDGLDEIEQKLIIVLVVRMDRNGTRDAPIEWRKPGLVLIDHAYFDGKEHIGSMLLNGGERFPQRSHLILDGKVIFHLVESYWPFVRQKFPPRVDGFF